ncbi:hypothetical protein C4D60_Mb09t12560 [Musa balbisiana]|uniref:Uncharacterized protein n=1 Tax=Musa balbisiana TaxID=52838 RepID=A0A4S8IFZ2_MUSBA|nr:hypothetical protein C4D60_Mb09t12560 [Musa balbisiana]
MSSLLLSNVLRYHRGEQQEKVEEEGKAVGESNGFRLGSREEAEASSDSSSIGAASTLSSDRNGSDHGGEEDEEESKSFASLSDVANASTNDIVKPENPFNKRRRVLMMSKMRRASCSSLVCPPLPPLSAPAHTVAEADEEEEEEDEEKEKHGGRSPPSTGPFPRHGNSSSLRNKAFRSPRSFSLSDLQHV